MSKSGTEQAFAPPTFCSNGVRNPGPYQGAAGVLMREWDLRHEMSLHKQLRKPRSPIIAPKRSVPDYGGRRLVKRLGVFPKNAFVCCAHSETNSQLGFVLFWCRIFLTRSATLDYFAYRPKMTNALAFK